LESSASNGVIKLDSIEASSDDSFSRLTGSVTFIKHSGPRPFSRKFEIFFEVPKEYGEYLLTERCDAFVVLFLHVAASRGYDIVSSVPMSSDLYYNISEHLLPVMNKNSDFSAKLEVPVADPPKAGFAVGTGLSCGVDSLSTVKRYVDHPSEDLRLTHLCINNVGAYNHMFLGVGIERAREAAYARAREAAEMIGLPLVETNSNVHNVFPQNYLYTHSFTDMFSVFCLSKLWKTYHYASAGIDHASAMEMKGWQSRDSAEYELILFRYLSTRRLMLYTSEELDSRLDKLSNISDYSVAKKCLNSCTSSDINCGICDKCMRNLTALDCLGKLDNFSAVYDLEKYRGLRDYYLTYVFLRRNESMYRPVYERFVENGDEGMKMVIDIDEAVKKFDTFWEKNDAESDVIAIRAIIHYKYSSVRAAVRMARAYSLGRGVKKSPKLQKKCQDYIESCYRKEISSGMDRSRFQLFDFLWIWGRYDELVPMLEPVKDRDKGKLRYAKMYRYGIGLEKDEDQARRIMEELVKKDPKYIEAYQRMFPDGIRTESDSFSGHDGTGSSENRAGSPGFRRVHS